MTFCLWFTRYAALRGGRCLARTSRAIAFLAAAAFSSINDRAGRLRVVTMIGAATQFQALACLSIADA